MAWFSPILTLHRCGQTLPYVNLLNFAVCLKVPGKHTSRHKNLKTQKLLPQDMTKLDPLFGQRDFTTQPCLEDFAHNRNTRKTDRL